jgi:hypothetical protein
MVKSRFELIAGAIANIQNSNFQYHSKRCIEAIIGRFFGLI